MALPVGYVHDDGQVMIDSDAEVQAAIGNLFAAFTACGSAYGVVAAFANGCSLPAYGGPWVGQLRCGKLAHARVLGVRKNPCYTGANGPKPIKCWAPTKSSPDWAPNRSGGKPSAPGPAR